MTVCCAEGSEGHVYAGACPFEVSAIDAATVPATRTHVMLIVGDPSRAFALSAIPNAGVGLARTEFIVTNHIGIHPMALARYPRLADAEAVKRIAEPDRHGGCSASSSCSRFSEGVGRIAAAFYPKPVIVRTSDFKTNEYAELLGRPRVRAARREPDDRLPRGVALLRPALCRRALPSSARRCCGPGATWA